MRDQQGRFLPGPDKDRHQLTIAEKRRGWKTLVSGGKKGQLTGRQQRNAQRRVSHYYRGQPYYTQGELFDE